MSSEPQLFFIVLFGHFATQFDEPPKPEACSRALGAIGISYPALCSNTPYSPKLVLVAHLVEPEIFGQFNNHSLVVHI